MNYQTFKKQIELIVPAVNNFSFSLTRDIHNSQDLAQQALSVALSKPEQFRDNSNLKSWLFRIVYTTWIDIIRKNKTIRNYQNTAYENHCGFEAGHQMISSLDTCIDCKNMFNVLSKKQRAPFYLVCIEGYSYRETAEILGIPAGTVASRVAHSRAKFHQYFSTRKNIKKNGGHFSDDE